jgi:hypothetical protein
MVIRRRITPLAAGVLASVFLLSVDRGSAQVTDGDIAAMIADEYASCPHDIGVQLTKGSYLADKSEIMFAFVTSGNDLTTALFSPADLLRAEPYGDTYIRLTCRTAGCILQSGPTHLTPNVVAHPPEQAKTSQFVIGGCTQDYRDKLVNYLKMVVHQ